MRWGVLSGLTLGGIAASFLSQVQLFTQRRDPQGLRAVFISGLYFLCLSHFPRPTCCGWRSLNNTVLCIGSLPLSSMHPFWLMVKVDLGPLNIFPCNPVLQACWQRCWRSTVGGDSSPPGPGALGQQAPVACSSTLQRTTACGTPPGGPVAEPSGQMASPAGCQEGRCTVSCRGWMSNALLMRPHRDFPYPLLAWLCLSSELLGSAWGWGAFPWGLDFSPGASGCSLCVLIPVCSRVLCALLLLISNYPNPLLE